MGSLVFYMYLSKMYCFAPNSTGSRIQQKARPNFPLSWDYEDPSHGKRREDLDVVAQEKATVLQLLENPLRVVLGCSLLHPLDVLSPVTAQNPLRGHGKAHTLEV